MSNQVYRNDAILGEVGMKLSGRERQRISIARALLRHTRLSTIMHADVIYVLEKVKIVETGSHINLLS
jgi:ATP-binding cassette, subfamily B, bacterial